MTYMGGGKKIMESRIMVSLFSPLFSIFPPFASVRTRFLLEFIVSLERDVL